jgi:hypothetical protein
MSVRSAKCRLRVIFDGFSGGAAGCGPLCPESAEAWPGTAEHWVGRTPVIQTPKPEFESCVMNSPIMNGPRPRPGRTVLQSDQAMSSGRQPSGRSFEGKGQQNQTGQVPARPSRSVRAALAPFHRNKFLVVPFEKDSNTLKQNRSSLVIQYQVARLLPRLTKVGRAMCEKCVEIDEKIEHYQRLSSGVTDQPTLDGIKELIAEMSARKAALHPDRQQ